MIHIFVVIFAILGIGLLVFAAIGRTATPSRWALLGAASLATAHFLPTIFAA